MEHPITGTIPYLWKEYIEKVHERHGDLEEFELVEQPVYINKNAFISMEHSPLKGNGSSGLTGDFDPQSALLTKEKRFIFPANCRKALRIWWVKYIQQKTLERVRIVDAEFEKPDGRELILDIDYLGWKKSENSPIGPITLLKKGSVIISRFSS